MKTFICLRLNASIIAIRTSQILIAIYTHMRAHNTHTQYTHTYLHTPTHIHTHNTHTHNTHTHTTHMYTYNYYVHAPRHTHNTHNLANRKFNKMIMGALMPAM